MKHHTVLPNRSIESDPIVIHLNEEYLDKETKDQVTQMVENSNSISHARIMPDCHIGQGCCIGFTCTICHDRVTPSYVGGDIGCGILTYPLNKKKLNLVKVEKTIKSIIPMGNGHTNVHSVPPIEESFISRYLSIAQNEANDFSTLKNLPSSRTIDYSYFLSLCDKIDINVEVCLRSFGTLGGGNHFVEINLDESCGEHYLTIHSGSRSFGQKLFEHYNSLIEKDSRELSMSDSHDYCFDMIIAQQLAIMNRHIMLQLILRSLDVEYFEQKKIESIHNYIDFGRMILRKGAIAAELDSLCIVALNMRDGILICKGKGNPDWNFSCAHGCGRFFSRSTAKRSIKLRDYQRVMKDVVSTSVCSETIDESPQAYKEKELIISAIEPTVEVLSHFISVVSMKGTD